jgi:hypothetical protein
MSINSLFFMLTTRDESRKGTSAGVELAQKVFVAIISWQIQILLLTYGYVSNKNSTNGIKNATKARLFQNAGFMFMLSTPAACSQHENLCAMLYIHV